MKTKFNFTKKIISILLCVALIMPHIPVISTAAPGYTIDIAGVTLSHGQYLANGATSATTTKPSGGYAYWDANKACLTLNNFTYERKWYWNTVWLSCDFLQTIYKFWYRTCWYQYIKKY